MKNAIYYFYNISIDDLTKNDEYYYFFCEGRKFILYKVNDMFIDCYDMYQLNQFLIKKSDQFFEIILNKNNQVITTMQNDKYILMVDSNIDDRKFELQDLLRTNIKIEYNPRTKNSLIRKNWIMLWKKKIDYLENFVNYNINKYCDINKYINYFIGMAENSLSYLNYILNVENYDMSSNLVVSHNRININSIKSLYNPLNLIVDHLSRDISEYLKSHFFDVDKKNRYNFLESINLSREENLCIVGRLIFPSYFFDSFESFVSDKITEVDILRLIDKANEYEIYLLNIMKFLKQRYNIIEINWLKKVDYSSTLTTPRTSGTSLTNIDSIPSFNVTSIMLQ